MKGMGFRKSILEIDLEEFKKDCEQVDKIREEKIKGLYKTYTEQTEDISNYIDLDELSFIMQIDKSNVRKRLQKNKIKLYKMYLYKNNQSQLCNVYKISDIEDFFKNLKGIKSIE